MSSSRQRRAFSAKFKAEVVLSLLTGTKTQAELCRQHELSPNLLSQWKDAFLQNAAAAFQTSEQNSTEGFLRNRSSWLFSSCCLFYPCQDYTSTHARFAGNLRPIPTPYSSIDIVVGSGIIIL